MIWQKRCTLVFCAWMGAVDIQDRLQQDGIGKDGIGKQKPIALCHFVLYLHVSSFNPVAQ
jgi:hypothetical protein